MEIRYRGRAVTEADIVFIRELIAKNPSLSRRKLSAELCRAWNWVQPNGELKDMVCRGLMLELHRQGQIVLPAKRQEPPNPLANRAKPSLDEDAVDTSPVDGRLSDIQPIEFRQVRRKGSDEQLFNGLIEHYHYLGYTQPVGEQMKYLVLGDSRPVACFSFSSAPRHLGPRDRYIGWSPELRRQNIHLLAYNSRYLIFPWVRVRYLASHLLSKVVKIVSADWEGLYHHPVHFIETFVNSPQYKGTCYRAANWLYLGKTTGRGKDDLTHKPNRPVKEVLVYPLVRSFREKLCEVGP
ncbi:MAG: DUF4338 domain-containing protein [bacterium]|nr:DUF4338 domain-containing protein [bacterium]